MVGAFARAGPVTVDAAVVLVVKLLVLVLVGYLKESLFFSKIGQILLQAVWTFLGNKNQLQLAKP